MAAPVPTLGLVGALRAFPQRLAATDALRPDQEALVARFVDEQDWPARTAA